MPALKPKKPLLTASRSPGAAKTGRLAPSGLLTAATAMPPRIGWRQGERWVSGGGRVVGTRFGEADLAVQTFLPGVSAPPTAKPVQRYARPITPGVAHGPRKRPAPEPAPTLARTQPDPEARREAPHPRRRPPPEPKRAPVRSDPEEEDTQEEEVRPVPTGRAAREPAPPRRRGSGAEPPPQSRRREEVESPGDEEPEAPEDEEKDEDEDEDEALTPTERRKAERIWAAWQKEHGDEPPLNDREAREARIRLLVDQGKLGSAERRELEALRRRARSGVAKKGGGEVSRATRAKNEARLAEIKALAAPTAAERREGAALERQARKAASERDLERFEDAARPLADRALGILKARPLPPGKKLPTRAALVERYQGLLRLAEIRADRDPSLPDRREATTLARAERTATRRMGPIPAVGEVPRPEVPEPKVEPEVQPKVQPETGPQPDGAPERDDDDARPAPDDGGGRGPRTTPFTWVPARPTPLLAPPTGLGPAPVGEAPVWVSTPAVDEPPTGRSGAPTIGLRGRPSRPERPAPVAGASTVTPGERTSRAGSSPPVFLRSPSPGRPSGAAPARRGGAPGVLASLRRPRSLRHELHDRLAAPILARVAARRGAPGRPPLTAPAAVDLPVGGDAAGAAAPIGADASTGSTPRASAGVARRERGWRHDLHDRLAAPILRRVDARRSRRSLAEAPLGAGPAIGLGGASPTGTGPRGDRPGGPPRLAAAVGAAVTGAATVAASLVTARPWTRAALGAAAAGSVLRGGSILRAPLRGPDAVGLDAKDTALPPSRPGGAPPSGGRDSARGRSASSPTRSPSAGGGHAASGGHALGGGHEPTVIGADAVRAEPSALRWSGHRLRPAGQVTPQHFLTTRGGPSPASSAPAERSGGAARARSASAPERAEGPGSPERRRWQAPNGRAKRRGSGEVSPGSASNPSASPLAGQARAARAVGSTASAGGESGGLADLAESELVQLLELAASGRGEGADLVRRVLSLLEDRARIGRMRELG